MIFSDAENLKCFLGKTLGKIDTSRPDNFRNPKNYLKNLLGSRVYTARISERIANSLDGTNNAGRCPSFRGYVDAP